MRADKKTGLDPQAKTLFDQLAEMAEERERPEHVVYLLTLNNMRSTSIDVLQPVRWSLDRKVLIEWIRNELVAEYTTEHDGSPIPLSNLSVPDFVSGAICRNDLKRGYLWLKHFAMGGPLEWFNPPLGCRDGTHGGVDTLEARVIDGAIWIRATGLDGVPEIK